ncbi:response regulator [Geothrix fuzhouensis]|uniref:response regulator n=1 Tax=Geothrix fuzhouensis TaxID=2966451 RepID=UPI002147FF81|nr:response regulator [Geothrix fuzhouensis]
MPRLLLVDDNPSIHRIAESLLAPTDVELVCVDSAAEALDRFGRGEHFDVALVDTAMPGMDGWALLARLREMEATAHLPIALMAGVLDPVDPVRLAKAPIQGFLKKPIELRELGDRVRALLAMPVVGAEPPAAEPPAFVPAPAAFVPEPPALTLESLGFAAEPPSFADRPAAAAPELAKTAEMALPDLSPDFSFEGMDALSPLALASEPARPAQEPAQDEDLLILTAEDLWPEESAAEAIPVPAAEPVAVAEVHLELEELDLESLHGLTSAPLPSEPAPAPRGLEAPPAPPVEAAAPVAEALAEESLVFTNLESLDDLGAGLELAPLPGSPMGAVAPAAPPIIGGVAFAGLAAAAAPLLEKAQETHEVPVAVAPTTPVPAPRQELAEAAWPMPVPEPKPVPLVDSAPAVPGQVPAAPGQAALTPGQVQALLADPAVMDVLVKAVVARMGDQVVREIAWEVMPELAGRLQR